MGCHCKQTGPGLLGLACPGAGKGQLLQGLAPSPHRPQQVREGEEQNGRPELLRPCRLGARGRAAHGHFTPLTSGSCKELEGRGATLENCRTSLSVPARRMPACDPHVSFPVLQGTALGAPSNFLPGKFRSCSGAAAHHTGSKQGLYSLPEHGMTKPAFKSSSFPSLSPPQMWGH